MAGIMGEARATTIREDMVEADVELKIYLLCRILLAEKNILRT
jgi:hypothetical protein